MAYFTKEEEEQAVALILKECNFCGHDGSNSNIIRNVSYVERDEEGYVIGLVDLGLQRLSNSTTESIPKTRHWIMPPAIGYLTRLRKLTVYHCKSLPREIVYLSDSLQEIAFHFCEELNFDDLPLEFESLQQLTDFRIHGTTMKSQRILPIHRLQNFSNLRYLYYRGGPSMDFIDNVKEEIHYMLDCAVGIPTSHDSNSRLIQDLLNDKIRFKKSLEILEIEGGNLSEYTVADIFSDVLPQYPNLKRLILPNNNIRSLAPIIARQPLVVPPTVRLRSFYLMGNPVLDVGSTSPESSPNDEMLLLRPEQLNLLRILSLYDEITSLGHGITESGLCTTDMLLALDLNNGGNVLLSERFKPIPLSVWPVVLERVNQRKGYYESTNVLYHLLRNGPAMGIRRETKPTCCCAPVPPSIADVNADVDADVNADAMRALDSAIRALDSVVGVSPVAQFQPCSAVVTPTTTMTMTRTRKRKACSCCMPFMH